MSHLESKEDEMKMEKIILVGAVLAVVAGLLFFSGCGKKKETKMQEPEVLTGITSQGKPIKKTRAGEMPAEEREKVLHITVSGTLKLIKQGISQEEAPLGRVAIVTNKGELIFVFGPPNSTILRRNIGKTVTVTGRLVGRERYMDRERRVIVVETQEDVQKLESAVQD